MKKGTYQILSAFLIVGIIIVTLLILNDVGVIEFEIFKFFRRLFS